MSDPIGIVKEGNKVLAVGETDGGEFRPLAVDADGKLQVGSVGGTVDTELPAAALPTDADANEAVPATASRLQAWFAGAWARVPLYDGPTLSSDLGLAVHIASAPTITTQPAITVTAQPAVNADAGYVRIVPMGTQGIAESLSFAPATELSASSIPAADARGMIVRPARTGQVTATESQSVVLASDSYGLDAALPLAVRQSDGFALYDGASEATLAALLARKRQEAVLGHGEQRVAKRSLIAEFSAPYVEDLETYGFVGTGTHAIDSATRSQRISVDGTNGQTQSWESHTKYQLPVSQPVAFYGVVAFSDAGQPDQIRRIQIGDSTDYLGLELNGTDLAVVGLSALTGGSFSVPRASWLDPLDGTGPSGYTLDLTQFNTFEAVLGVPGITQGYASINDVKILDLPAFTNVGGLLKHQEHPLRAVITNNAATSPGSIFIRGFAVYGLGDYKTRVLPVSVPLTNVSRSVDSTGIPLLSVRPKATLGGVSWRGFLLPKRMSFSASGNGINYQLWLNPTTLTGPSWVSAGAAVGFEYDVSATAKTGGTLVASGYVASDASGLLIDLTPIFEEHLSRPLRNRVDGTPDVLVLYAYTSLGVSQAIARLLIDVVG